MKVNFKEKILVDEASYNKIHLSTKNILYSYFTNKSLHVIDATSLQELYSQRLTTPIHSLKWSTDFLFFVLLSKTKKKLEVIKFSTNKNDFIPFYSISSKLTQFEYFKAISSYLISIEEHGLSFKIINLHTKKILIITDPKFTNKTTFSFLPIDRTDTKEKGKSTTNRKIEKVCLLRRINFEDVVSVVDLTKLRIISEFKLSVLNRQIKQQTEKEETKKVKPEISFIKQIDQTLILLVDNINNTILVYTLFGHLRHSFHNKNLDGYFPFTGRIDIISNHEVLLYNFNNEIVKINRITEEINVLDTINFTKRSKNLVSYFSEEEKKIHFINNETEIIRHNKSFKITKNSTNQHYSTVNKGKLDAYAFIKTSSNNNFLFIVVESYRNFLFVLSMEHFAIISILRLKSEIKKITTRNDECLITTGNRDLILWTPNEFYSLEIDSSVCRKVNNFTWNGNKLVLISNVFISKGLLCFWKFRPR